MRSIRPSFTSTHAVFALQANADHAMPRKTVSPLVSALMSIILPRSSSYRSPPPRAVGTGASYGLEADDRFGWSRI